MILDILLSDYKRIPIVTRSYCTACFVTTLAVYLEFVGPHQLYYNPKLLLTTMQIWRPITCFLFLGKLNFSFFFRLLAVYRCCRMLEEDVFRNRTGDLVFMLAFCGFFILLANCFLGSAFLAQSFLMSMIYLWCRNRWYRFINLHLIGQIAFPALFLPLIILLISMVLYKSACMANLLGILVGHLYFFFDGVFPQLGHGFQVLRTPRFLRKIFDEHREPFTEPAMN
ncbi:hypothetical protein BOX15_Mlig019086g1 [Macrostomum lignano]|uniref:Derlin n=1 Tax=Macrostomum lignano TaxID=282301 RepID=A0A267H114_9PLAT|nr:hypothetical protein BOX15_Mlig019086g1 [Macrostomum lignano]